MIRILVIYFLTLSFAVQGEVLFRTDFSTELGGNERVDLPSGSFDAAAAEQGMMHKCGAGIGIVADSWEESWAPPPETEGAGALRLGFERQGDYQLLLALPEVWDSSRNYTFSVRYRVWPKSGKPTGKETGDLGMYIGIFDDNHDIIWFACEKDTVIGSAEWVTTTQFVPCSKIASFDGQGLFMRLQSLKNEWNNMVVWVDRIEICASPVHTLGLKL